MPGKGAIFGLRRLSLLITTALAVEVATVAPLMGQMVQGRVLSMPGESPVAGALVTLVDTARREVARAASTQSGGFALSVPGPGKYVIVVRQIGYQAWYSGSLSLASGATYPLTVRIEPVPYALPTITVEARRPHCGIRLEDDEGVVARLLDLARTALALASAAAASDSISFSTVSYTARLTPTLQMAESTSTTSRLADWPIQSADPDSLRDNGFVQSTGSAMIGPIYYGPDARVLFSDWFLASHCFRVGEEDDGLLPVRFAPRKRHAAVDIEGSLAIDSRTLELHRFEFTYVGLPRWVPRGKAGGMVRVQRLRGGAWVPHDWRIRAPVPAIAEGRGITRLDGWMEAGGRVTAVRGPHGELDTALTSQLLGAQE
jgi:hypothetical protein